MIRGTDHGPTDGAWRLALVAIGVLLPIVLAAGAIGAITIWWRLRKARARGESTIIITQFDRRDS